MIGKEGSEVEGDEKLAWHALGVVPDSCLSQKDGFMTALLPRMDNYFPIRARIGKVVANFIVILFIQGI